MRVLGIDPGTKNFGAFAGEVNKGVTKVNVHHSEMFDHAMQELKGDALEQVRVFEREYMKLLTVHRPDIITIERFQSRGLKGKTVELVNVMMGVMMSANVKYVESNPKLKVQLLTASTWKNAVNRVSDLELIYRVMKKHGVVAHRVDAALMSLYKISENPYGFLKVRDQRNHFFRQMAQR